MLRAAHDIATLTGVTKSERSEASLTGVSGNDGRRAACNAHLPLEVVTGLDVEQEQRLQVRCSLLK